MGGTKLEYNKPIKLVFLNSSYNKRRLHNIRQVGEVHKLITDADGEYFKVKIEVDVYLEQQKLPAQVIRTEGIAEANGIQ